MLSCLPTSAYERFCERQSSTWRCRSVRGLERSKPRISEALGCSDRETTMRLLRICKISSFKHYPIDYHNNGRRTLHRDSTLSVRRDSEKPDTCRAHNSRY